VVVGEGQGGILWGGVPAEGAEDFVGEGGDEGGGGEVVEGALLGVLVTVRVVGVCGGGGKMVGTSSFRRSRYQIPSMKVWYLEGRKELLAKVSALWWPAERSLRI